MTDARYSSTPFLLRLPYLGVFPFTLFHLPLNFIRVLFITPDVSAPIRSTLNLLTFLGEFTGLGLALVPDIVVLKAEHGCA